MIDYDKLLNSIPQGLDKIEIARFLYIELGRYFIYDPDIFSIQDKEERKKIAYRGIDDIKDNKVVCTSLSPIYTELLRRCGINAETIYIPENPEVRGDIGHAYIQVEIDGEIGNLSLIEDLTNIKVGFKTKKFLPEINEEQKKEAERRGISVLTLDEDSLKKIDEKIGYTYNRYVSK